MMRTESRVPDAAGLRSVRMQRLRAALMAGMLYLGLHCVALPLRAMETDQFLAWRASLDDVSPQLNEFFNGRVETVLGELNQQPDPTSACADLVAPIFSDLHLNPFASRLRAFLEKAQEIERYPDEIGNFKYFKSSVYRRPAWPFYLPLASTVNVGGVSVGLDKFPHMFGAGRRYHTRYREALASGESPEEAMRSAILAGVKLESGFLGRMADGIFSFADLEANYQGLLLALDLCEGEEPYLVLSEAGWQLSRPIDLRAYINPGFDESYNNNRYSDYRWNQVRGVLEAEYCPLFLSDEVQALYARYRAMERPSFSATVIREYLDEKGVPPQWEHSMEVVCKDHLRLHLDAESGSP